MEIVLLLGFTDAIFRRERSDDRKCVCASQANYSRATVILARIEACVSHVDSWLVRNKLKVNRGKTELLILNASHRPRPPSIQ